jgi:hypothetical protein
LRHRDRARSAGVAGRVGEARGKRKGCVREDSVAGGSTGDQVRGFGRRGDVIGKGARPLPRGAINPGNHDVSNEGFNSAIGCAVDLARGSARKDVLE